MKRPQFKTQNLLPFTPYAFVVPSLMTVAILPQALSRRRHHCITFCPSLLSRRVLPKPSLW
jgi:hypothetical protein